MKKGIAIYGCGGLGKELLQGLGNRGISLYQNSYGSKNCTEEIYSFNGQEVKIVNSDYLRGPRKHHLHENVSCLIVTLTGDVLEKEIYFLLSLKIPLVICSTKFDQEFIKNEALKENVSVVMSDNMALPIIDFWNKIDNLDELPKGLHPIVNIIESHQEIKKDVSGSAIKALKLFMSKGFLGELPDVTEYKLSDFSKSGSIVSIRGEEDSLLYGVQKKYIEGHAYHRFCISFDINKNTEFMDYYNYFYNYFKSLEKYSIEGILTIKVSYLDNVIEIIHNINGRDIYSDGVFNAIQFLITNTGVFTALDLLEN